MNENRYFEEDFNSYLDELLDIGALDGAALGITKFLRDNEYSALSEGQKYTFNNEVIKFHSVNECTRCSNDVPWSEMNEAADNGGYCGWCIHQIEKED